MPLFVTKLFTTHARDYHYHIAGFFSHIIVTVSYDVLCMDSVIFGHNVYYGYI